MTAPAPPVQITASGGTDVEPPPGRGQWRFTRQQVLDSRHIPHFAALYRRAFDPLRTRAAARQVLTATEFVDQMRDPRVLKLTAWDESGQPVGMTTLTNHLEAIPWVSPEYYAKRYPEQWARGAVYYVGFILAAAGGRRQAYMETILRLTIQELLAERPVFAFDACAFNVQAVRFDARIQSVLDEFPGSRLEALDTQHYAAMTFA